MFNDCVKRTWRIGARVGAQDLRMRAGIWSGPVALLVSSLCSNFVIPLVEMSREGIGGYGLSAVSGVLLFSCVNTDWKCVLSICALCSGSVASVLLLSFKAVIAVVSCLRALKNLKKCLVLFLTLSARKVAICVRSAFLMFFANVFWKLWKAVQFSGVLCVCARL